MNDEKERSNTAKETARYSNDPAPIPISIIEALQGVENYLVEKSIEEFDVDASWAQIEHLIDAECESEADEDPGAEPPAAAQFNSSIGADNVVAFPEPYSPQQSATPGRRCAYTRRSHGKYKLAGAAIVYGLAATVSLVMMMLLFISQFAFVYSMAVTTAGVLSLQGLLVVGSEFRRRHRARERRRQFEADANMFAGLNSCPKTRPRIDPPAVRQSMGRDQTSWDVPGWQSLGRFLAPLGAPLGFAHASRR